MTSTKAPKTLHSDKKSSQLSLEAQLSELQEKLARSLADYDNLQKRVARERQLFADLAAVTMVSKLIPLLDDLHLAQAHLLDQGLAMTINKFRDLLKAESVEEINPHHQAFDPNTMECVEIDSKFKHNTVATVRKIGYRINGQLIRPAQVIVGRSPGPDHKQK